MSIVWWNWIKNKHKLLTHVLKCYAIQWNSRVFRSIGFQASIFSNVFDWEQMLSLIVCAITKKCVQSSFGIQHLFSIILGINSSMKTTRRICGSRTLHNVCTDKKNKTTHIVSISFVDNFDYKSGWMYFDKHQYPLFSAG